MSLIKITTQGAPIVNSAYVRYRNDDVLILELDMHSKYCGVFASSGSCVFIGANERSLYLHGDDRERFTEITLLDKNYPEFVASSEGRYSITLVFGRKDLFEDGGKEVQWLEEPK